MESGYVLCFVLFLVPLCSAQEPCSGLPPNIENSNNNSTGTGATGSPPFQSGTSVSYKCNPGYKEHGTVNALHCIDGKWEGKLVCHKIKCGSKNPPENGDFENTFNNTVGSKITIVCNDGFNIIGSNISTCKEDGNWSPTISAVCEPVDCGEYGNIEHGTYEHLTSEMKNSYGSKLFVTCDPGYVLGGWQDVQCEANGTWGHTPKCINSSCGSHPAQKSSCIYQSTVDINPNTSMCLVITCWDNSRNMSVSGIGDDTAWCVYGKWSALDMGCFCDCKLNADFSKVIAKNVDHNTFLKHGEQLDWDCEIGFEKKNETQIKCLDGKAGTPECEPVDCGEYGNIEHGTYEHLTSEMKNSYGSKLFVTCDPGYVLGGWQDVQCEANGTWGHTPKCINSSCGSHPAQKSSCIYQSTVDINPSTSMRLMISCWDNSRNMSVSGIGDDTAWCVDGKWSALDMGCFCDCKLNADFSKVIAKNVDHNTFLKHGEQLDWDCEIGFEKKNETQIKCLDGKAGTPECEPVDCGEYGNIEHGTYEHLTSEMKNSFTFNNTVGSKITILCNDGFNIIGSNTSTCKEDGNWSPTISAVCEPVDCGEYGNIEHGTYEHLTSEMKNSYGSKLFVTCDPGYVLGGWQDVQCEANGTWGHTPKCINSSCGSHPAQKSSCIYQSTVDINPNTSMRLMISCWDNSRNMSVSGIGDDTAWCVDGKWSALDMGCFCDCKLNADFSKVIAKNVDHNKFLKHGEQLDWDCEIGFEKKNETQIKCLDGKAGTPECVIGKERHDVILYRIEILITLITFIGLFAAFIYIFRKMICKHLMNFLKTIYCYDLRKCLPETENP